MSLTAEELEQARILADPVQWAYVYLDWEARWYQEEILRNPTTRCVCRMGRRTGKSTTICVYLLWYSFVHEAKTSVIVTPYENQIRHIWEIFEGFIRKSPELEASIKRRSKNPYEIEFGNGSKIKGFTAGTKAGAAGASIRGQGADVIWVDECVVGDTLIETPSGPRMIKDINIGDEVLSVVGNAIVPCCVTAHRSTGVKTVISLKTAMGYSLLCTPNHPVLTPNGWVEAAKATSVAVNIPLGRYEMEYDLALARLAGYGLGDGWLCDYPNDSSGKYRRFVAGFAGEPEGLEALKEDIRFVCNGQSWKLTTYSRPTGNSALGISGITNCVHAGRELYDLLRNLGLPVGRKVDQEFGVPDFVLNGSARVKAEFLAGLFGAEGNIPNFQTNGYTPRAIALGMHKSAELWDSHVRFFEQLKSLLRDLGIRATFKERKGISSKTRRLELVIDNSLENQIRFLEVVGYRYCYRKELAAFLMLGYLRNKQRLIEETEQLRKRAIELRKRGLSPARIAEIFGCRKEIVYSWLYSKYVRKIAHPPKANLIPYDAWLNEHYIEGVFYDDVVSLEYVGERSVYNMTVDGGHSYIANGIVTHNCDYLNEQDIVAVTAIALEAPGRIQIILSSTPSGRRGFFYKVCTDPKSTYRQFHYPSHVNPEWTPEADEEFRLFHSEVDYQHEVLAEFGEEASGVFNKALVEKAAWTLYYTYLPLSEQQRRFCMENNIQVEFVGPYTLDNPAPPALRTMGVDWDKVSSTPQIVIVEYNESLQKFQVILRESIPKSEFTLDNAVNRIIELNEIYNPAFIYCDRGFGEYQVETLHAHGLKHPQTGLAQKVKGKHFGENLELVDPATKELVKKPLKHFMVNQTSIFFERQKLLLSPFDEELFNQIINYSVVRVTASGQPVYTSKNEHALDAMMLAILAFVLEFPELASTLEKPQATTRVRAIKPAHHALYERVFGGRNSAGEEREPDVPRWQPARSVTSISWAPRGRATWGFRRRVRI